MSSVTSLGIIPGGRDPDTYDRLRRRVLWSLPTGLYLLGSRSGEQRNMMTVSLACQVATEPKLVGVAVEAPSVSHRLVSEGGAFTLNVLERRDRAVIRKFVKPVAHCEVDETGAGTMQGVAVRASAGGLPVLQGAAAYLECQVRHVLRFASHSWFVGEVSDCAMATGAGGSEGGPEDSRTSRASGEPGVSLVADESGSSGTPGGSDRLRMPDVLRMEDTRMSYGG